MPLKAGQLLSWAEVLARFSDRDGGPKELMARDAVRHSYYACFHAAIQWAEIRGYEFPGGDGMHSCLWNRWYRSDSKTREIGRRGKSLMSKRIDADYKVMSKLAHDPDGAVNEARELLDLINADVKRVEADADENIERAIGLADKHIPK